MDSFVNMAYTLLVAIGLNLVVLFALPLKARRPFLDRRIDHIHGSIDAEGAQACDCHTGDATFVQVYRRHARRGCHGHAIVCDLTGRTEPLRVMGCSVWVGATENHRCFGEDFTNCHHSDRDTEPPETHKGGNQDTIRCPAGALEGL
jgi:hypothetical protein